MPGGIDEVERVLPLRSGMGVLHLDGMALDGDAFFAFEVHVVEGLLLELALGDGAGLFQQAIRQRALAVVDVCDDAKIAKLLELLLSHAQ